MLINYYYNAVFHGACCPQITKVSLQCTARQPAAKTHKKSDEKHKKSVQLPARGNIIKNTK